MEFQSTVTEVDAAVANLRELHLARIAPGEEIVLRGPAHVVLRDVDGEQEANHDG
jgi:hypothetical protein